MERRNDRSSLRLLTVAPVEAHPHRALGDETESCVQSSTVTIVVFGLEIDPRASRGPNFVEDEFHRARTDPSSSAPNEQFVEESLRATGLDRVSPGDTGITLGARIVVDVDGPQDAVAVTLEEWDESPSGRRGVEFVAIDNAVLLDEFEEIGQIVDVRPSDGDGVFVQPTTSMRTISIAWYRPPTPSSRLSVARR